jgi:hypothetical protein
VETGQITSQELAAQLAGVKSVTFRMALKKRRDTWRLHTVVIEVFPSNPEEKAAAFTYEYNRAAVLAGTISGAEVAAWLTHLEGHVSGQGSNPKDYLFRKPALQEQVTWNRYSRHNQSDMVTVPWPYTRYDPYWSDREVEGNQSELLVSDEFPFFPDFQTALFDVVHRATTWRREQRTSLDEKIIVRIAHPEAWMERIDVSPIALTIALAGTNIEGTHLELSGPPSLRFEQRVESEVFITCPLSAELPAEWWVVLSRGGQWLDYYHHVDPWSTLQSHVTTPSPDLAMQVKEWVAGGEDQTTEFKREVSTTKVRFLQTVVGFANGEGGVILIGIPNDNPTILGFPGNVNDEKVRLAQIIRDNLTAMPPIRPEHCEVEGKKVIVIFVEQGEAVPYGIKPASPSQTPLYYVRRGASNFIAQPGEINAAVQQRIKVAQNKGSTGLLRRG